MSEAVYQEHAKGVEQTLGDLRSMMFEHEKKFNKGERQMRQCRSVWPLHEGEYKQLLEVALLQLVHYSMMISSWPWYCNIKTGINCLLSRYLIAHHPSLKISLASVAPAHLEEPVKEDRLTILDEVGPQGWEEVFHACLWILQSFSVQSLLEEFSSAW